MKLEEVQVRDKVSTGEVGDYTSRFSARMGWDISLDAGVVTVRKGAVQRLIPMSNVVYASPMAVEAKPAKPGPTKAA